MQKRFLSPTQIERLKPDDGVFQYFENSSPKRNPDPLLNSLAPSSRRLTLLTQLAGILLNGLVAPLATLHVRIESTSYLKAVIDDDRNKAGHDAYQAELTSLTFQSTSTGMHRASLHMTSI